MADSNNISIKIQADASGARTELANLVRQVRESGKAATDAERAAITAAKQRVKETRSVIAAERDMGAIGIRSNRQIKAEIDKVNAALGNMIKASSKAWNNSELDRAVAHTKRKLAELKQEMSGADKVIQGNGLNIQGAFTKMAGAWVAFQGALAAGGLVGAIEEMRRLEARLVISEGSSQRAAVAMGEIKRMADETRAPVRAVADAYIRFSTAIQRTGGSQQQAVRFTELLSKALKVSGASADTTATVMLQLGQAFESGRLQGDEFKSVAENGGQVLNYLADALKVSRGELRRMGTEGELTAEAMLKLSDVGEKIDRDYGKLPVTVGEAITKVVNKLLDLGSTSSILGGILNVLAAAIVNVADNLGLMIGMSVIAGFSALIISVGGLAAAFDIVTASIVSVRLALTSLMTTNPILLALTAILTYIVWQWNALYDAAMQLMDMFGMKPKTVMTDEVKDQLTGINQQIQSMQSKLTPAFEKIKKEIDETRKAATASVKEITNSYASMAGQIDSAAKDQISVIQARYKEEQRLIAETKGSSDAKYAAETAALVSATQEQLQVLQTAAAQKLALIEEEGGIRKAANAVMFETARERAAGERAIDNEILTKKREVLSQVASDYRQHIDALNAEAQRHLDAVKTIEDQKRQLTMTADERIRAIRQGAMGEYAAYQDKIAAIDEMTSKAREAIAKGDSELAQEYARKAMESSAQVAGAVTENGKEVVTQSQAAATAISKIEEAKQIGLEAMTRLQAAHNEGANTLKNDATTIGQTLTDVTTKLSEVNAVMQQGATLTINTNAAAVLEDVQKLEELITSREVLMTVQSNIDELKAKADELKEQLEKGTVSPHEIRDNAAEVQKALDRLDGQVTSSIHYIHEYTIHHKAGGGAVGHYAGGGIAKTWRRIMGKVRGPGSGTSDSVFAKLSNGEFVIKAASVRKFGARFFEALNAGFMPPMPHFAAGGAVNLPVSMPGSSEALTVTFRAGDMEAPVKISDRTSRESMKAFARELQKIRLVQG